MVHVQVMLVYTEAILIAQYIYQIPTRLHCAAITPQVAAASHHGAQSMSHVVLA